MYNLIDFTRHALPDDLVEAITTILIAVLSWYVSRKKTQAREREK